MADWRRKRWVIGGAILGCLEAQYRATWRLLFKTKTPQKVGKGADDIVYYLHYIQTEHSNVHYSSIVHNYSENT